MLPNLSEDLESQVRISRAENGFVIRVFWRKTPMDVPALIKETLSTAETAKEPGDFVNAITKLLSRQSLREGTARKPREIYIAKSTEEAIKLLSEILGEMAKSENA